MNDIQAAIEAINKLNPQQLAEVLSVVSTIYMSDAMELGAAWQNKEAGKVWEIAALGFQKTADNLQKYWNSL